MGCLPSIGEATKACSESGQAWACHSEPTKVCCGFASENRDKIELPLRLERGVHLPMEWD
jgi:hypothetical protein